jgi:Ca2+-binding RTX toxin-like protein
VRLTGDGTGALGNPQAFNLNLPQYLGSLTIDYLTLMRRPDANPAPLLVIQHGVGSFGRELCISYELDGNALVCNHTPVQGPLVAGDLNGSVPGVPPDEIITAEPGDKLGIFGFAPQFPLSWSESNRPVPGGVESVALGHLDGDGLLDIVTGQFVNSLDARVDSIHYFTWDPGALKPTPTALPSIPGLDAVAVADIDGDGHNDVVGAGGFGQGVIHLGDGAGHFDGGQPLAQLASGGTRVTMAVADLTGDGLAEVVVSDYRANAVMVYCNASKGAGGACTRPVAVDDAAVLVEDAAATAIDVLANDTDADGGPKLAVSVTQPAHGSSALAGTGVTYRPDADYCNDLGGAPRDTFTYTLNGGSTATVSVTVQCVDDTPPVIIPPAVITPVPTAAPVPAPTPARTCDNPGTVPFTVGTPGDDVLVGSAARDVLSGRGGDDCLLGRGGDDRISGGTGADLLNGSSGGDRLNGDAGDDKINGGNGNDDITPGAGKDKVAAQGGDDMISARDGARDTIDCGAGRDKVTADRTDVVKSCEYVKRAKRRG